MSNKNPVVCSWGGGVQSTAIAEMVLRGDLPRPDLWIFADTGDEPVAIYPHVEKMFARLRADGHTCLIVKHASGMSLSEHTIMKAETVGGAGAAMPPMFVADKTGTAMPLRRKCTSDFKINVLKRAIKQHFDIPRRKPGKPYHGPVIQEWMGISLDEAQRMRISQDPWVEYVYPLIDRGLKRLDCIRYLKKYDNPAPRSACTYCPFHSNREWRNVKQNPKDWAAALDFERRIRAAYHAAPNKLKLESEPFLHRSRVPLDEANIGEGQMELFGGMDNECAGICGV